MHMTEYNALYRRAMEDLREVEIKLGDKLSGFFYLHMAGLSHTQHEQVLSSLPDGQYPEAVLQQKLAQFFPHIQEQDSGVFRRDTSRQTWEPDSRDHTGKHHSRRHDHKRRPHFSKDRPNRSVWETEHVPSEEEGQSSSGSGEDSPDPQETLITDAQTEIDGFLQECNEAGDEGEEVLESISENKDLGHALETLRNLDNVSEALQTVRYARAALHKRKGFRGEKQE